MMGSSGEGGVENDFWVSGLGDSGCAGTVRVGWGGSRFRKENREFSLRVRFLGATQTYSHTHRRYECGTPEQIDCG